jgi:hypothetical protein
MEILDTLIMNVVILDQKRRAKIQWIQTPTLNIVDNLNNVRRDASRYFRSKTKAFMKGKIENLKLIVR